MTPMSKNSEENIWDQIAEKEERKPIPAGYPDEPTPIPTDMPKSEVLRAFHYVSESQSMKRSAGLTAKKRKSPKGEVLLDKIFTPRVFDEETSPLVSENDRDNLSKVKEEIIVYPVSTRTLVSAAVIDREEEENNRSFGIKCAGGVALGGYPYNMDQDAYIVQCCDVVDIGSFGFGYRISMNAVGNWKQDIPIPASVLERSLSVPQREIVAKLREKYKSPRYEIHFIQMISCG